MWNQFILENLHFTINLFLALVFFAVSWLYLDAWLVTRRVREVLYLIGFLLVSLAFLLQATVIQSPLFSQAQPSSFLSLPYFLFIRLLGYIFVLGGLIFDPIQKKPTFSNQQQTPKNAFFTMVNPLGLVASLVLPALALVNGLLYLRKATFGLERHLKVISFAFILLSVAEIFNFLQRFQPANDPSSFKLVSVFGLYWFFEYALYFLVFLILGRWIRTYLTKRFQSQLYFSFIFTSLVIFLVITITFTGIILKNFQDENTKRLGSDVKILQFWLESKKAEQLSNTQLFAQDPILVEAVEQKNQDVLSSFSQDFLQAKTQSLVVITDINAQVIARGDDPEKIGNSLSENKLVKNAIEDKPSSSMQVFEGVLAPEISIQSAAAIKKDGQIIGALLTGILLDSAFSDGVKSNTGLDSGIYVGDKLSATSILDENQKRPLGTILSDKKARAEALEKGKTFSGEIMVSQKPFFASFVPLLDSNNNQIGTIFIAVEQLQALKTAADSIQLTFLAIIGLVVASLLPAYFISVSLSRQIKPD